MSQFGATAMDSDLRSSGKRMWERLSAIGRKADGLIQGFVTSQLDHTPGDDDLRVFVSYRREAGPGQAHRLASDLERYLGAERVFLDERTIGAGEDWGRVIAERVGACDVLLAVVGPGWLDAQDDAHQQRLFRADDYVRREIEMAIQRRVPVIPVSVPGATMPPLDRLPETLAPMLERPALAIEIPGDDFWAVAVDSLARWLLTMREEKRQTRKEIERATEQRARLEREIERTTGKQRELTADLQEAKQRRATLEQELPEARERFEQLRREAEPARSGAGIRAYITFRPETSQQAARLERDLASRLGADRVFATETLPDDDLAAAVSQRIANCDVLVTLIGPSWGSSQDVRGRVMSDPDDTPGLEMEAALARRIPLIPLLVHTHEVPEVSSLPDSLRLVFAHQTMPLPDQFWDSAVEKLLAEFDKIERDIESRETAVERAMDRVRSLERELERATRAQAEHEHDLASAQTKLQALHAKLEEVAAEQQRLAEKRADQSPAYLAGPPRPRAAAVP